MKLPYELCALNFRVWRSRLSVFKNMCIYLAKKKSQDLEPNSVVENKIE